MSHPKPQICCPNPNCVAPLNQIGSVTCQSCKTTLIYRYLWAVGNAVETVPAGSQVAGRYHVSAPRIWLDTQPSLPPDIPDQWLDAVTPYLHLYPYRLHIPEVYGFCSEADGSQANQIFLLENVPLDASGSLYPSIAKAWSQATAVRQIYWLWQLWQLWASLSEQGVAASLLAAHNLRVEGWRVRLCQLYQDRDVLPASEWVAADQALGLADLANLWLDWVDSAKPAVVQPLQDLCQHMRSPEAKPEEIAAQLNQLLLEQAAQLPLRLQAVGATDTGPERSHNEDSCYPTTLDETGQTPMAARLVLVCDGIGGHEGGEVASQMAVQSLKLQAQALLTEAIAQPDLIAPDLLAEQIEASVRVVNNLIANQNDIQGREERRRMGTTLVMGLQVSQPVPTAISAKANNSHELYLVNVGDSRAYWITQRYCHQLTVDDDVAAREVRMGRSLYREALLRPDSGALIQALGTRDADFLNPTIQRFILEEDGLLLLCSDGLSDNNLVEQTWIELGNTFFKGKRTLEQTAKAWVDLANQQNGHDNTSVVLLYCRVSSDAPEISLPKTSASYGAASDASSASRDLTDESLETSQPTTETGAPGSKRSRWALLLLGLVALTVLGGAIGYTSLKEYCAQNSQSWCDRIPFSPNKRSPRND